MGPVAIITEDPRGGLIDVEPPRNLFREHYLAGCKGRIYRKEPPNELDTLHNPVMGYPAWYKCYGCGKVVFAHADGQPPTRLP